MTETPTPHWQGHPDRLRSRLLKRGPETLDDYEILEVMRMAFIARRDVKPLARALKTKFGSPSAILAAPVRDLVKVDGVGETVAACFKAVAGLHSRAAREEMKTREVISSRTVLVAYVQRELQHEKRERFRVIFLDRKNQLILDEIMGRGTVDHAPIYPREVAGRALEVQASSLVLVHSHPSGDPQPSRANIDITRELMDALQPFV